MVSNVINIKILIRYFAFFFLKLSLQNAVCTAQLGLAIFKMLSSCIWLVVTIMDSAALGDAT